MKIPAVKIRGLKKSFNKVQALNGVDLTIKPGEFLGLLGPNGAGKTTTINIQIFTTLPIDFFRCHSIP